MRLNRITVSVVGAAVFLVIAATTIIFWPRSHADASTVAEGEAQRLALVGHADGTHARVDALAVAETGPKTVTYLAVVSAQVRGIYVQHELVLSLTESNDGWKVIRVGVVV